MAKKILTSELFKNVAVVIILLSGFAGSLNWLRDDIQLLGTDVNAKFTNVSQNIKCIQIDQKYIQIDQASMKAKIDLLLPNKIETTDNKARKIDERFEDLKRKDPSKSIARDTGD